MIRLQRWDSGPCSAAFSSRIPDTFVENVKICPRSPAVSLSTTQVRQAPSPDERRVSLLRRLRTGCRPVHLGRRDAAVRLFRPGAPAGLRLHRGLRGGLPWRLLGPRLPVEPALRAGCRIVVRPGDLRRVAHGRRPVPRPGWRAAAGARAGRADAVAERHVDVRIGLQTLWRGFQCEEALASTDRADSACYGTGRRCGFGPVFSISRPLP
jgi:hypothetical protein